MLDEIEVTTKIKFAPGRNRHTVSMRLNLDELNVYHHPLLLYAGIRCAQNI